MAALLFFNGLIFSRKFLKDCLIFVTLICSQHITNTAYGLD